MEKSSRDAVAIPHIVYPVSLSERLVSWKHMSERVFYFPVGIIQGSYFWYKGYIAIHLLPMEDCNKVQQLFSLQFRYHYNQSPMCSKLQNETFCNVISAICQRT